MEYESELKKALAENDRLQRLLLEQLNKNAELKREIWHLKDQLKERVLGEYEQQLISVAKGILSELNVK
ncbi:hypothetical protein GCM10023310_70380 [Paenibacillus vulneris]|uniref:Translation initiation factor 2 n=1 Tax=Paenibacillus vulneris TaxID=1133364 RepID=A0ABW3UFQ2_9BACL